ncbi:MAG: chemotaxis protein CheW, partial [candidate division WOR-3 bacterium]
MDFISFYSNLEKKAKKVEVTEKTFQFISFNLGNEEYAIEMLSIKEIVEIPYITRVPKAPYYVVGVMNLRGYIVPIVDLRRRFNIPESRFDEGERKIIILEGINKDRHVGIIVDRVNE